MKRRITGVILIAVAVAVASGLVFAETGSGPPETKSDLVDEVNFTAKLHFSSSISNQVAVEITNYGEEDMQIAADAHYMDNLGSAGSWDCRIPAGDVHIKSRRTEVVVFRITENVTHGDNSILAFFFQYQGEWYLGKVGKNNGIEYFLQHN